MPTNEAFQQRDMFCLNLPVEVLRDNNEHLENDYITVEATLFYGYVISYFLIVQRTLTIPATFKKYKRIANPEFRNGIKRQTENTESNTKMNERNINNEETESSVEMKVCKQLLKQSKYLNWIKLLITSIICLRGK